MTSIAHYAVLRFQPYANRSEHVNYGLVVFVPEGGVQVFIPSQLRKVKAMFPAIDLRTLKEQEETIPELVADANLEDAVDLLNAFAILPDQEIQTLGKFVYSNQKEFRHNVQLALSSQVAATPLERQSREIRTRLFTDVRVAFKNMGILAPPGDRDPDHQVIENYSPDPEVDLKVEFALQNSKLHLAQTIDLRAETASLSKNAKTLAYSKAYAMDFAWRALQGSALATYVIVAGTDSEDAKKIISALEKSNNEVIAWESGDDQTRFFEKWAAASKTPPSSPYSGAHMH